MRKTHLFPMQLLILQFLRKELMNHFIVSDLRDYMSVFVFMARKV